MTDLTFLVPPSHVSPMPFPAQKSVFRVGRPVSRSNTDTLESDIDSEAGTPGLSSSSDSSISRSPSTSSLQSPTTLQSPGLLAPPVNTWKSRSRSQTRRSRHRVTRSQSAPPGRISSSIEDRQREVDHPLVSAGTVWPIPRRSVTSFSLGSSTRGGELIRPPPPLCKLYSFSPLYPIRYIFSPFSPFFHFIDNTHLVPSSPNHLLAQDQEIRRNRCILLPVFPPNSPLHLHRSRAHLRRPHTRPQRSLRRISHRVYCRTPRS